MTVSKEKVCSVCGKPEMLSKGLSDACYRRQLRQKPEVKAKIKSYNATGGKLAQQKYRAGKRSEKSPKSPKEVKICGCGKLAIVKGFCKKCYQRQYIKIKQIDIGRAYEDVLGWVKKGLTIRESCKKLGIDSRIFYQNVSEKQRLELSAFKTIARYAGVDDDF